MTQSSRLSVIPNIEHECADVDRFIPLASLIGPFEFPLWAFRRKLQQGNQVFGDFALFPSDPRKRAQAFNHKKLMDLMVYIFDRLSKAPRNLEAKRVVLFVKLEDGTTAEYIRHQCSDLGEAYAKVESFVFFIEVFKKNNGEDDVLEYAEADYRDLDDVMDLLFQSDVREKDNKGLKRKRAAYFANRNEIEEETYNLDKESLDLTDIFRSPVDVGRMIEALFGNSGLSRSDDKKNLHDLPYALSKIFNPASLYADGNPRAPVEYIEPYHSVHGECLDLCRGLSFSLLSDDFTRDVFGRFVFPDIRKLVTDFEFPIPDDDTMTSVVDLELDRRVTIKNKSAFLVLRERLNPSHAKMEEDCKRAREQRERFRIRSEWQKKAMVPFKALFNTSAAVSPSLRSLIEDWETKVERDHGIRIPKFNFIRPKNLDLQSSYVKALFDFAEESGFYCHHATWITVFISSRWACRKGKGRGPHMILFGSPGSGKSHIIELTGDCTPEGFYTGMSSMSRLAWAVKDKNNPDNPDTCQTQIAFLVDEVPATYLGAGDAKKQGEGDDNVTTMKEMLTNSKLTWRRNIESKTADGLKTRSLEEGKITNEPVFLGGMNRPPSEINEAFKRRISMVTCQQFKRGDKVTFENCKVKGEIAKEDESSITNMAIDALKMNAQLHTIVAFAEYCKLIKSPFMGAWKQIMPIFKQEIEKVTTVQNFDDRLEDAKNRVVLMTRMIACFEVYQKEDEAPLTFDQITERLLEVEKKMVAGERLCVTILTGLEDVCFPLMHKIVLLAVKKKWRNLEQCEESDDVYVEDNVPKGRYAKLSLRSVVTRGRNEEVAECVRKALYQELRNIISSETSHYKIKGGAKLSESAIEELMMVYAPDHPVLVPIENATDGRVEIYISLPRLEKVDFCMLDVVKKLTKKGTQLLMTPYKKDEETVLPQFPMYVDAAEGEDVKDATFMNQRLKSLHLDSIPYVYEGDDERDYPREYVDAVVEQMTREGED
jgi:hypothetical protein